MSFEALGGKLGQAKKIRKFKYLTKLFDLGSNFEFNIKNFFNSSKSLQSDTK